MGEKHEEEDSMIEGSVTDKEIETAGSLIGYL